MNFQVKFDINERIYLRNPENSEVGKLMVKKSIDLIYQLGFEQFTIKNWQQRSTVLKLQSIDTLKISIAFYFIS